MAYLAIARKWRPQKFEDIVGQTHVTRTLQNAIQLGRIHHAFLFTGARGVGKTTAARILAKSLNCEKGPTPTPCNECRACKEITVGTASDVQEIDAASNTGVDSIRELRDNSRYLPSSGKYKIYIVDEVHMLSTAAFNALLKTLEEPPPHVIFIFATTDPQKVPDTILSRCQRFDFKRIPLKQIAEKLQEISSREGVSVTEASLLMISREADGSMRDAQSLLDQVISSAGSALTDEEVVEILGLIDRRLIYDCIGGLLDQSPERALATVDHIYGFGFDMKVFARELLEVVRNLNVVKVASQAERFVDVSAEELNVLRELATKTPQDVLSRMFALMLEGFDQVARSEAPRQTLEMTLLRMSQIKPVQPVDELILRIAGLESLLKGGRGGGAPSGGAPGGPSSPGGPPQGRPSFGGGGPGGQRAADPNSSVPAPMSASSPDSGFSRNAGTPSGMAAQGTTSAQAFRDKIANRAGPPPGAGGGASSTFSPSNAGQAPGFSSQTGETSRGSTASYGGNNGDLPGDSGPPGTSSNRPPVSFTRPEGGARGAAGSAPEVDDEGNLVGPATPVQRAVSVSTIPRPASIVALTVRELADDKTRALVAAAGQWIAFLTFWNEQLHLRSRLNYLKHASPVREDPERIVLGFRNQLTLGKAEQESSDSDVQGLVRQFFQRPLRLECRLLNEQDSAGPSFLAWEEARERLRRSEIIQKELSDPRVKAAQTLFGVSLQDLRFEFERTRP